jgi:pimeloyl-ACP methyl ester carboxylesterase
MWFAIDARGHGESEKPYETERYGSSRMADDVQQLVDHLGFASYDLVGYSMGGIVSATVASRDSRVHRLVLGGVGGALVDRELASGQRRRLAPVADGLDTTDPTAAADASATAFRNFAKATHADLRALAAVARANPRDRLAVEHITAPTLVIVGADDALARSADRLAAAITGATLTIVPGDHLGAVTKPEFRDALVSFLA